MMPTIPISARQLTLPSGVAIVGGVMLFQGDEKQRHGYQAAAAKQWGLDKMQRHELEIDAAGARWFATHPTAEDGAGMIREPYRRGSRAGEILLQHLEGKPLKRAQEDAAKDLAEIYSVSPRTFEVHGWPSFKPVAHLWAVHLEWIKHRITPVFPCNAAQLRTFLKNAEALLEQAVAAGVLDEAEAWRAAPDLLS